MNLLLEIGVAAGFDINGEVIGGVLNLGFSTVEVGFVSSKKQSTDEVIEPYKNDGAFKIKKNITSFLNSRSYYRPGYVAVNVGAPYDSDAGDNQSKTAAVIKRCGLVLCCIRHPMHV